MESWPSSLIWICLSVDLHQQSNSNLIALIHYLHHKLFNNVTGLGLSNTNSDIGARNSIKQRAIEKNRNVFASGCPWHILHNTASKANSEFSKITKFDLGNYSVDLYYWFDKFPKQKDALLEYYEFCDQEVIRYASTR